MKRFTCFLILVLLHSFVYAFQDENLYSYERYKYSYVTDSPLHYRYFIYQKSVNDEITYIEEAMYEYYNKTGIICRYLDNQKQAILLPTLHENDRIARNRDYFINHAPYTTKFDIVGNQYLECLNEFKREYNKMRSYYYTKNYIKDDCQSATALQFTVENALENYMFAYQEFKSEIIVFGKNKDLINKNHISTQKTLIPEMKVESNNKKIFWVPAREECGLGENKAISDFEKGDYKIYTFGERPFLPLSKLKDRLFSLYLKIKYDVQVCDAGCVFEMDKKCYNEIMYELLDLKFEENIFKEAMEFRNTILAEIKLIN